MEAPKNSELPKMCTFYKEGKCRFGSECYNLHQESVLTKSTTPVAKNCKKTLSNERKYVEKSMPKSMKTALDVIKTIQWDEMLPSELFSIGYLDRFTGIQEDEFTKFSSWGNIVSIFILQNLVDNCKIVLGQANLAKSKTFDTTGNLNYYQANHSPHTVIK